MLSKVVSFPSPPSKQCWLLTIYLPQPLECVLILSLKIYNISEAHRCPLLDQNIGGPFKWPHWTLRLSKYLSWTSFEVSLAFSDLQTDLDKLFFLKHLSMDISCKVDRLPIYALQMDFIKQLFLYISLWTSLTRLP